MTLSKQEVAQVKEWVRQSARAIVLHTANNRVDAREAIDMLVKELNEWIEPCVLGSTPPVLSVGMRCMEHGYSFVWLAGRRPYFILPCGAIIELEVRNNVPYMTPGLLLHRPRKPKGNVKVACGGSEKGSDEA